MCAYVNHPMNKYYYVRRKTSTVKCSLNRFYRRKYGKGYRIRGYAVPTQEYSAPGISQIRESTWVVEKPKMKASLREMSLTGCQVVLLLVAWRVHVSFFFSFSNSVLLFSETTRRQCRRQLERASAWATREGIKRPKRVYRDGDRASCASACIWNFASFRL